MEGNARLVRSFGGVQEADQQTNQTTEEILRRLDRCNKNVYYESLKFGVKSLPIKLILKWVKYITLCFLKI